MYKYGKIIAFLATVGWLGFTYAAFKGFNLWYTGFVLFFWLALSSLNYRHETSLWLLKNKPATFTRFYLFLVVFFFAVDIIGQKLSFWILPPYNSNLDWTRLYLVTYPVALLVVLEAIYFVASLLGERFKWHMESQGMTHLIVDRLDLFLDLLLLTLVLVYPILILIGFVPEWRGLFTWGFIIWTIVATIKFVFHVRHPDHWLAIIIATSILTVFMHELPNTEAFEWQYLTAPLLNQQLFGIPFWVILGWYISALLMLRFWRYFVLRKPKL